VDREEVERQAEELFNMDAAEDAALKRKRRRY